jgi:hypothetical protein
VDAVLMVWRFVLLGIALYWLVQIAIVLRKPADWRPPNAERYPWLPITRNRWLAGGVAAIVICSALIVASFVVPDFP